MGQLKMEFFKRLGMRTRLLSSNLVPRDFIPNGEHHTSLDLLKRTKMSEDSGQEISRCHVGACAYSADQEKRVLT